MFDDVTMAKSACGTTRCVIFRSGHIDDERERPRERANMHAGSLPRGKQVASAGQQHGANIIVEYQAQSVPANVPAPASATLQLPQADTCAKFDHHIHDRRDGLGTPIRTNLVTCTPRQSRPPFMRQENCTRHAGSSEPCRSYSKGSLEDGPSATELTSSAQSRLNKRTSNRESSPQILCQL